MFESAILFAIGAMFFWAVGDFLIHRTTKKISTFETMAWVCLFSSITLLPFVYDEINLITSTDLMFILILSIVGFAAAYLDFEAFKKGKLAVVDVILTIELPITIGLSVLFFNESPSALQYILFVSVLMGLLLISFSSLKDWKKALEKGVLLALGGGIATGVVNFMTAKVSIGLSPEMAIWAPWVVVGLISLVIIAKTSGISKFIKNGLRLKKLILAMCVFDTLAWLFYAYAVKDGNVSVITAITESYPAFGMILGVVVNKEHLSYHQYAGAVCTIAASIVLAITF